MRRIRPMFLALLSLLLLPTASANAATIVAPNANETVEGNTANSYPFNNFTGRYQQAYAADQFPSDEPFTITEIAFRTNAGSPDWASALTFTVNLSTSLNPVGSMSDIFADNIGPDQQLVYDSGLAAAFTGTDTGLPGPNAFDLILTLDTPFFYNPADGDLLMEVLMETQVNGLPLNSFSYLDAVESENELDPFDVGVQRMYNSGGDVNALDAPDPEIEGAGLVTRFNVVPEPGTGVLFMAGLLALAVRRRV